MLLRCLSYNHQLALVVCSADVGDIDRCRKNYKEAHNEDNLARARGWNADVQTFFLLSVVHQALADISCACKTLVKTNASFLVRRRIITSGLESATSALQRSKRLLKQYAQLRIAHAMNFR